MAAKRADEVNRGKAADEAHQRWEAEKNRQLRTAWQHELQHQQSLAELRQKHQQHKVCWFAILTWYSAYSLASGLVV